MKSTWWRVLLFSEYSRNKEKISRS
ncbi:LOW QUALITY PROTEIN: hypothetical protein PanWU01x14_156890 [Parasponia andersonii]|uniref:Uncharacterized protein n=1 Tax=Parasponia andersonii TaxID=3476 RepID=A0A2P5CFK6_PARAD|nr:LOW QUALITY PROTEIN: hypothetical protein PanWU01x14_156890 [Parasponia andersonii]